METIELLAYPSEGELTMAGSEMALLFYAHTTYWGVLVWAKPYDSCYISSVLRPTKMVSICFPYIESGCGITGKNP